MRLNAKRKNRDISVDLKKNGIPHKVVVKGSTKEIILPSGRKHKYFPSTLSFTPKELHLLKKVEKDARVFGEEFSLKKNFRYNRLYDKSFKSTFFPNVVQIDIEKAYWTIARHSIGFISQSTYDYGENMKFARNASIGRLYSEGAVIDVDSRGNATWEETIPAIRSDLYLETCRRCYVGMEETARLNPCVLMYWVDALFVPSSEESGIIECLEKIGLKSSVKGRYKGIYKSGNKVKVLGSSSFYQF